MSSQDTGGSNLGGINQQQIAELMQTLGAGKTMETKEVKKQAKLPHEKDTAAKSAGKEKTAGPDSGKPVLFPPIVGVMAKKGTRQTFSEKSVDLQTTITLKKTEEAAGQIETLSQEHPGIKFLQKLTGNESKTAQLLNEALQEEGVQPPVSLSNPKMSPAIKKALAKIMKEKGVNVPEAKAQIYGEGLDALKTVTTYASYLPTIDPTGKSYNTGPGLEKVQKITGSVQELVNGILDQLENNPNVPEDQRNGLLDFLGHIAKLISELQQVLIKLHIEDSKSSGAIGRALEESQDKKREAIAKKFHDMAEKFKLQKYSKWIQNAMKIITPIMSGLMILTSLIFLPICPVVTVVMIGIAITQLAAMTALTETGAMKGIFKGVNNVLSSIGEKLFKTKSGGDIFKVIFWGALLIGLVVATLLLTLLPMLGPLIPMISVPIITTILTQSTFIDKIMEGLQHVTHMSDKLKMILTAVVTMVFTLVITLAVELFTLLGHIVEEVIKKVLGIVFTGGLYIIAIIAEALAKVTNAVIKPILRAIIDAIKVIIQVIKKILEVITAVLKTIIRNLENAGKMTGTALNQLKQTLDKVMAFLKEALEKTQDAFRQFSKWLEDIGNFIEEATYDLRGKAFQGAKKIDDYIDDVKDKISEVRKWMDDNSKNIEKTLEYVTGGIQMSGQVMTMSAGIASEIGLGTITKRMSDLTKKEGDLDYIIKLLSELIKSLQALMAQLQGKHEDQGVGEFMKQVNSLSDLFKQIIASMSGITDELAASATV